MPDTVWKQDFFSEVEPIVMVDALASTLGATDEYSPIYYSYTDCVKLAGHACASVSGAYMVTKLALKELYGGELPERGEIEVRLAGDRVTGANGPIGQVIQFITGAAVETGFHGLAGRFVRAGKFVYDEDLDKGPNAILAVFTRLDTGKSVEAGFDPSGIPVTQEEAAWSQLMPKVIQGIASEDERELFFKFWQGRNRKILLEEHPGVFTVTPL